MRVKPYNPVKPVNGVKIVEYKVGDRIEIPIELAFGRKIPPKHPVMIGDTIYIVKSNNGTTITITPKTDESAKKDTPIAANKNQYKDFYINKMRAKR